MTAAAQRAPDRVVFVTTDFRPRVGGVADYLHRLADALAARAPVTVMTTVAAAGETWPAAYRLEHLSPLPDRHLGDRVGDGIPLVRKLHTGAFFAALRRHGNELVARIAPQPGEHVALLVGIWDTASHFWCGAARRADLPYNVFAYGVEIVNPLYGRLPDWRREDFSAARRVIGCSQATAALAADRFGIENTAVVNPSVGPRPPAGALADRVTTLRRRAAISDGPVLLSVGRLIARKGFDLVLRGVAELRRDLPNLTYVIAGDGPERAALEELSRTLNLSAQVCFLGAVDDGTKWAAYDACDIFVMPSRLLGGTEFEGFGIVYLEAALSERPAIGGRTGGASDAIVDNVTGLLVDPEQPGAIAQAVRRLAADPSLRRTIGRAAGERARTVHAPRAAADRLWAELGGRVA